MKWEDLKPKKKGGGGKTPPFATRDSKLLIFNPGDEDDGTNNEGYQDYGTVQNSNQTVFKKDGFYYVKNDENDYVLFTGWVIPYGSTTNTAIYIDDGKIDPKYGQSTGPENGSDSNPSKATPPPTPSYQIWGTGLTGSPSIYATSLSATSGLFTGTDSSNTYTGLALKTGDSQTVYVVINGAVQGTSYTVNNLNDLSKQLATDESNMQNAIANAQATAQADEQSAQQSVTQAQATIKTDKATITQDEQTIKDDNTTITQENDTITNLGNENKSLTQQLSTANQTISADQSTITADNQQIAKDKQALAQANKTIQANEQELVNLNQSLTAQKNFTNNLINSKDKEINTLQTQNKAFSQALSGSPGHDAIAPGNTEVNPVPLMNTILSVAEFQKFTTNYYLSQTGTNGYFANPTLKRMQSIISNVELNLNAMLNGRLYEKYPPGAVVFRGYGSLTPQVEEQTLYQCLTECVEYRLITQQYVNLNNSYSGMVNGTNNYQTQNNNVIGLRQDIQAKLSLLGLYANVLLGKKVPKSTEYQDEHDGHLTINFSNLQQWYGFIQNTAWNFTKPISFQGGMTFAGNVLFTADSTFTGNISTKGTITSNGLTVNGPLNALSCDLTGGSLSNVGLGSFQNINVANASNLHNVSLSGTATMPSTFQSDNTNWKLNGTNNTFNCEIPSTFQDLTVKGKFTYDSSSPTAFNNTVTLNSGDLKVMNGTIIQYPSEQNPTATNYLGNTDIQGILQANNYQVSFHPIDNGLGQNSQPFFQLSDYLSYTLDAMDPWVYSDSTTDLLNSVNSSHIQVLNGVGNGCYLVEQYAVDIYDTTSPELIPGYMSPIADGQAYLNLQKLFLNTFGNGDLTNGYSYTFHCPKSSLPGMEPYAKDWPLISANVVATNFKVYIVSNFDRVMGGPGSNEWPNGWSGRRFVSSYYNGNPFPMGVVGTNMEHFGHSQPTDIRITLTVPYAVDNRQADDSMFLHGALQFNGGDYVVCVFKVRYLVNVAGTQTANNE